MARQYFPPITLQQPEAPASAGLRSHLPFPWDPDGYVVRGSRTGRTVFWAAPGPREDFRPFESTCSLSLA
jgi:hypothetical protein